MGEEQLNRLMDGPEEEDDGSYADDYYENQRDLAQED